MQIYALCGIRSTTQVPIPMRKHFPQTGPYAFLFMVRSFGPRGPDPFRQEDHANAALASEQLRLPGAPA